MNKTKFIQVISNLYEQHISDIDYAKNVGEAMGVELNPYNNSRAIDCVLDLLCDRFNNLEEAKSEIRGFMYDRCFGYLNGEQLLSAEDLWDNLIKSIGLKEGPILKKCKNFCKKEKSLIMCNKCNN